MKNGKELHSRTRNDQMDIFQTQTSAQLILARATFFGKKGLKKNKGVAYSYIGACNNSSTFGENKIVF